MFSVHSLAFLYITDATTWLKNIVLFGHVSGAGRATCFYK